MAKPPKLEAILTESDWSKHKGIVAKVVKHDTGIGAKMKEVSTAYGNVDWDKFDADKALDDAVTPKDVDDAKSAAQQEYKGKVEALRDKVVALRDLADKTAKEWKKSPLVPSKSQKHVEAIKDEANTLWGQLKDNAPYLTEFVQECDKAKKELASGEVVKPGEKPKDLDDAWWKAHKPPRLQDANLAVKMNFFWCHYGPYKSANAKTTDDQEIMNRINWLRQMIAGLDQTQKAVEETIKKCKPGVHDNTKAALQHYLVLIPAFRKLRMQWIDQEKVRAKTSDSVRNHLQEKLIGPGLDRL